MKYSNLCCEAEHKSPEKRILTWLRKRISPISWGVSERDKCDLHFTTSKAEIIRSYKARQLGGRGYLLPRMPTELMMRHFLGREIAYFQADGRRKTPETLAEIDIDCHDKGSYEGSVACAEWLSSNGFPGLFYSRSTNRKGIHGYIRIDKGNESDASLNEGLKLLERWLKLQLLLNRWDVEDIEVKGRPLVMTWGVEKYELEFVSMGSLAKLPVEALDRPEELMATALLTVMELRRLGAEEVMIRRQMILEGSDAGGMASTPSRSNDPSAPQDESFGEINDEDLRRATWMPSMRHGEWPKWIMHQAMHGLQVSDKLGEVLHELAKWLVWVEQYGEDDEKIVALLDRFVCQRHNGRISRINDGRLAEVRSQVRRAVRLARDVSLEGKEIMASIRQRRDSGKYAEVYLIEPLLSGRGEVVQMDCIPSTYCFTLRDDHLPALIEAKLSQIAQANKLRKKDGEYPLVRFARRFLNALWDKKGSARIGWEDLMKISQANKPDHQVKYKKLLRAARLIEDYEGKYCRYEAKNLYSLSPMAQEAFEADFPGENIQETA
jgi:hypothetical protein